MANAFRKKSFMLQTPKPTFIEEKNTILESRKQIIEVFIEKYEEIKVNENLLKIKDLPILVDSKEPIIAELEKPVKRKFEGKKARYNANHR